MTPHARLRAWRKQAGLSQEAVAERVGCCQSMVSKLELGGREANLTIAVAIERLTADWPEGPILATEWLEAKAADEAAE